uniref:MAPK kinase substrate protein n=1 Tax=Opuntia streptacantha TaxID=393608 RepID=A0A7C9DVC4_OPUST
MEGLQRSAISFRRQGSSGLVWDDKLLSGELNKPNDDHQDEAGPSDQKAELRRSKSDGGTRRNYRTVKVEQAEDPPSPRLSGCGFCSVFGKPASKTAKRKSGKPK